MEITVLQAIGKIYTSRYRVEKLSQTVDGLWRSLVAHLTGGQGVVGSNPASPTKIDIRRRPTHVGRRLIFVMRLRYPCHAQAFIPTTETVVVVL